MPRKKSVPSFKEKNTKTPDKDLDTSIPTIGIGATACDIVLLNNDTIFSLNQRYA